MIRQEIEAWALRIISEAKQGRRVEDSLVELKAAFPDPYKAARRIAAHANSAHGEQILWIIGIDEKTNKITNIDLTELSKWWAKVKSFFDSIPPDFTDIILSTPEGELQLLLFNTIASPYVVRNPVFGTKEAGPIEREVPFREGTSVRSSTREDLIQILVPRMKLPEVEILNATASVNIPGNKSSTSDAKLLQWYFYIALYITPHGDEPIVLPTHRTLITYRLIEQMDTKKEAEQIRYTVPVTFGSSYSSPITSKSDSRTIETTNSEAIIYLPGKLFLRAMSSQSITPLSNRSCLEISLSIRPSRSDLSLNFNIKLPLTKSIGDYNREWQFGNDST